MSRQTPLKIGIVGGGFAGTALSAVLAKQTHQAIDIFLCEKTGHFGAGPAYSTPYTHHLLNVRANDMSAFEGDPLHFVRWLESRPEKLAMLDTNQPLANQFVPRRFYYEYLQDLLAELRAAAPANVRMTFVSQAVDDVLIDGEQVRMVLADRSELIVDKLVLALGNNPPAAFAFPIATDIERVDNPWDYAALTHIETTDPVLIVGTGLSMIDAVLTLERQGHQGTIYAVSRHGLLPLRHSDVMPSVAMDKESALEEMALGLSGFTRQLRERTRDHTRDGGDWRAIIGGLRAHVPALWQQASPIDKRRFLRHLLPYWNIHRHRVHTEIIELLEQMMEEGRLVVMGGRVARVENGQAKIQLRHTQTLTTIPTQWVINCMGPTQHMRSSHQPLVGALLKRELATLDAMQLGFAVNQRHALMNKTGQASTQLYSLGAPTRGLLWEITAVPDIRKQVFELSQCLLS